MSEAKWYNMKWMVTIPKGRWMGGVNRFPTKKAATEFVDKWVHAELTKPDGDSSAEELRDSVRVERQYQL